VGGDGNHIVQSQTAVVNGLQHQQQRHDFGDAGGLQLVVGVLFIEDGAGFLLHQHRSGGVHRGRAADGLGGEDQKRGGQQGRSQFFHNV
jgi:hypothetical protein